jgi:serine/arginine repetitive matrix protein 2
MYNGIGLLTPRGSGTSGYVQGNKFNLRHAPPNRGPQGHDLASSGPRVAKADPTILEHRAKRELELKVLIEREKLEQEG